LIGQPVDIGVENLTEMSKIEDEEEEKLSHVSSLSSESELDSLSQSQTTD